ncbi:MAG: serine protease [Vicingaceae bacterium]
MESQKRRNELIDNTEQLTYSTIRIEAELKNGSKSIGTGFCYRFAEGEKPGKWIPGLITNKHVVEGATSIKLSVSLADKSERTKADDQNIVTVVYQTPKKYIVNHPKSNIDLCAINLNLLIKELQESEELPFIYYIGKAEKFEDYELEKLDALEDIIMIGYPNGIWDTYNNKPIIRNGCTATHPKKDYNGKKEIMVNIPSFGGSSGSPVFLVAIDGAKQPKPNMPILYPVLRVRLMGILYAGPVVNLDGEIIMSNDSFSRKVTTSATMNLGLIIKAEIIEELENEFIKEIRL